MATLRNNRKLTAVTTETQAEHPTNGQSRNMSVPRINEEYITQVSEEIEGRVSEKLSQDFSRTEFRILGALSKLDEFLLNQQIRTHSGTVLETFRNTNVENQEPNEDRSQDDPHAEGGSSVFQSRHSIDSDPDEAPHNDVTVPLIRFPVKYSASDLAPISLEIFVYIEFKVKSFCIIQLLLCRSIIQLLRCSVNSLLVLFEVHIFQTGSPPS